ncbi:unknown protein [Seminavis robusta]|uniref:Uncharacterized protein n=1 Tax=Seminavis robusta TaxID=568900 RepID=A0A9N8F2I6_9STRA|nr:unknown protein [Seminavis robusta]|eukprot:Sro2850_g338560.1 n/a (308) ;mRNA; r:9649-10649
MRTAGRMEDWERRHDERWAALVEQHVAPVDVETDEEVVARDNGSFNDGCQLLWEYLKKHRSIDKILEKDGGMESQFFDRLLKEFGNLTWLKIVSSYNKGPNFTAYGGFPFPPSWSGWSSNDSMVVRWTDGTKRYSRDLVLTNKDVIYVVWNKIISTPHCLEEFCHASAVTGGRWTVSMIKERFNNCFGADTLGKGKWIPFADHKAKLQEEINNIPIPDFDMGAGARTQLDLNNIQTGPVSPASLLGNGGISGSEDLDTQPRVAHKRPPVLRPVRTNLKRDFDKVQDVANEKEDDRKPAAKRSKKDSA